MFRICFVFRNTFHSGSRKANRAIGGLQRDFCKNTDLDTPYLEFSITTQDGKTLNWILNEWGEIYNSQEEFSIFFNFLTALTNQLYQLYHTNEPYNSYLKILGEKGSWEKQG